MKEHQEELRKLRNKYNVKKKTTKGRVDKLGEPIQFLMSFDEWLYVWMHSGQIDNMGLKQGQFWMSRPDDLGHYEIGNVEIKLFSQNAREGKTGTKHTDETKAKMSLERKGKCRH